MYLIRSVCKEVCLVVLMPVWIRLVSVMASGFSLG